MRESRENMKPPAMSKLIIVVFMQPLVLNRDAENDKILVENISLWLLSQGSLLFVL